MKSLLVPFLLLVSACGAVPMGGAPAATEGVPTNLVLRTYEVPNGAASQVRSVLKDLMWFGGNTKDSQKYVGRAEVGIDGQLVVLAPENVQEGVKGLIAQVAKNPPRPSPVIEMQVWMVLGRPAKESGAISPELEEVKAALAELEKVDGPQAFSLGEKLTAQAISGDVASVSGRKSNVRGVVTAANDGLRADLHFERLGQAFDTRMKLVPGQIIVLGSSGSDGGGDAPLALYYLVRAAIHDGSGR